MDFPGAVLSVAIPYGLHPHRQMTIVLRFQPDDNVLAVGMTGGNLLAIQRRQPDRQTEPPKRSTSRPTAVSHQVFKMGEYVKVPFFVLVFFYLSQFVWLF